MSLIPLGILAASGAGGGAAFESIATASGTGSSGTITLNSIPGTYQHLQLRVIAFDTDNTNRIGEIQFNSDTGTNYARHWLYGDGSSASASGVATTNRINAWVAWGTSTTNPTVAIVDILDYASTSKYKTVRCFSGTDRNSTSGEVDLTSGLWQSTSAITSITFKLNSGSFSTSSRFALYGIKGA